MSLLEAVRAQNLKQVRLLIKNGSDVNETIELTTTILHESVKSRSTKIVETLLAHGSNINIKDANGRSVLFTAIANDDKEMIEFLLEHGADRNQQDNSGDTALLYAMSTGFKSLVGSLVLQSQKITFLMIKILSIITESKSTDTTYMSTEEWVTTMITMYGRPCEDIQSVVDVICKCFSAMTPAEEELLLQGQDLAGSEAKFALFSGILFEQIDLVKMILRHGADPNVRFRDDPLLLVAAISANNMELVELLLTAGADANAICGNGSPLLYSAILSKNLAFIRLLLRHGADANGRVLGVPVVVMTAQNGYDEVIELLAEYGADFNVRAGDVYHPTALMVAIVRNRPRTVEKLLQHGADVNSLIPFVAGGRGYTSLQWAVAVGSYEGSTRSTEVLKLLLAHGADVHARSERGWNALHLAVLMCPSEYAEVLLAHGADIDSRCKDGSSCTPLQLATLENAKEMVIFLLDHGANINLADD